MKKLMVMLAAMASAVGLFADEPSVRQNGTSFEGTPSGTTIAEKLASLDTTGVWTFTTASATNVELGAWSTQSSCSAQRPAQFRGALSVQDTFLSLSSGNQQATRSINNGFAFNQKNVYVDTLVKFTAYEEDPVIDSNAKIAVWLKDNSEAEVGDKVTNLMVTAWNGTDGLTNLNCGAVANDFVEKWHRLTIKTLPDIGNGKMGFVVYIDGVEGQAKLPISIKTTTTPAPAFTGLDANAKKYYDDNQLFVAEVNPDALTSISVAGNGGIDDISFTDQTPDFAADYQFVTFTAAENVTGFTATYGDEVKSEVTSAQFLYNTAVFPQQCAITAITYADGYCGYATTNVATAANGSYTIGKAELAKVAVKIGETTTKYATMAAAFGAATGANATITLLDSYNASSETLTINNAGNTTILDLAGKVLTGTVNANTALVVTNSVDTMTDRMYDGRIIGTVDSVAVAQEGEGLAIYGGYFQGDISVNGRSGATGVIYGGQFTADVTEMVATGYEPVKLGSDTFWTVQKIAGFNITIDPAIQNGTVTVDQTNPVAVGTTVTVTATPATGYKLGTITVDGEEITSNTFTMPAKAVTVSATFVKQGFKVIIAGQDDQYFDSFADAVEAATAGATIVVQQNATLGAQDVTKALTISIDSGVTLTVDSNTALANDLTITGEGNLATTQALTVSATLDLSGIAYAQTTGCTGGFDITATGKVIFPNGVTLAQATEGATRAVNSAAQDAKIVVAEGTYTKYASGWSTVEAAVAKIGDNKYPTLVAAVAAVADGQKIKLLGNCSAVEDDALIIKANNVTLDLGGFTLTHAKVNANTFGVAEDKTVTVTNGTVTMTSGSYGFRVSSNAVANIFCKMEKLSNNNPTIDIYGGTLNCNAATELRSKSDIIRTKDTNRTSNINISGGTFYTTQDQSIGIIHHYKDGHVLNLSITGGDFDAKSLIDAYKEKAEDPTGPTLNFTKFDQNSTARFSDPTLVAVKERSIITDADLIAEGCKTKKVDEKWYKIAQIKYATLAIADNANVTEVVVTNAAGVAVAAGQIDIDDVSAAVSNATFATGYELDPSSTLAVGPFAEGQTYTIDVKAQLKTYTVTFTTNNVAVVGADTTAKHGQAPETIPTITESGSWDVNPATAEVTCNTNFNYTVSAGPEPTPITPEGTGVVERVEAKDATAATNVVISAIQVPEDSKSYVTPAAYQAYFTAKATDNGDGTFKVEVKLDEEKIELPETTADVAENLSDIAAGTKTSVAAKPGLYYSLEGSNDGLTKASFAEGNRVLATGNTVQLEKPESKTFTTKGFFRVLVNTVDVDK